MQLQWEQVYALYLSCVCSYIYDKYNIIDTAFVFVFLLATEFLSRF